MGIVKKAGAGFVVASAVFWSHGIQVQAQDYPTKPIRMIVPFPPGGSTDVTARVLADKLTGILGQAVVVDNKPGAIGQVGVELAAKAPNDGYTVLYTTSTIVLLPYTNKSFSVNIEKDLIPAGSCCVAPLILTINADIPAKTPQEVAAYFKANSGKINFATSGVSDEAAGAAFARAVDFKFENVRYNGGAPAIQAVASGSAHYTMLPLGTVKPLADAGKVTIVAVTSPQRYAGLPDVPTLSETVIPGYDVSFSNFLYAPAGTSQAIVSKLASAMSTAMATDDVKAKVSLYHMSPLVTSPEEGIKMMKTYIDKAAEQARASGMQPQ